MKKLIMSVCIFLLIFAFASCAEEEPDLVTLERNTKIILYDIGREAGFDEDDCKAFARKFDLAGGEQIAEIRVERSSVNGSVDVIVKDIKGDVYYVIANEYKSVFRIYKDNRRGEILWQEGFQ
ncbi:MAG: hypothetical protein LBL82_00570 [Oscillospiraceae bacterium]|jgi:hypothetical protein|nr:hypothetical protein [Oscillospiraceae bacterium]